MVRCRTCDREVAGSNPTNGCCVPTPTQRVTPLGSVNEYQRKLGSKRAYHMMHWPRIRGLAASAGVRDVIEMSCRDVRDVWDIIWGLMKRRSRPTGLKARERTLLFYVNKFWYQSCNQCSQRLSEKRWHIMDGWARVHMHQNTADNAKDHPLRQSWILYILNITIKQ